MERNFHLSKFSNGKSRYESADSCFSEREYVETHGNRCGVAGWDQESHLRMRTRFIPQGTEWDAGRKRNRRTRQRLLAGQSGCSLAIGRNSGKGGATGKADQYFPRERGKTAPVTCIR